MPRLPAHGDAPVQRLEPRLLRTIIGNPPSRTASVAATRCSDRYAADQGTVFVEQGQCLRCRLCQKAVVQLRNDTEGRAYCRRKLAAGKTQMEAVRALKRLSDVVYRQMVNDAKQGDTGPGGHAGATLQSRAADLIYDRNASEH